MTTVDSPTCKTCGQLATCLRALPAHFADPEVYPTIEFVCDACRRHDCPHVRLTLEWSEGSGPDETPTAALSAVTSGSFTASVLRAERFRVVQNTDQDEIRVEFEVPKGRGREFVERIYAAIKQTEHK